MEASAKVMEMPSGPIAEYHDRSRWLLERHRRGIGSSEVPIILGVDPFLRSEADLQRKKLAAIDEGRLIESEDTLPMKRGRLFEDAAIALWQSDAERGRKVRRTALRESRELPQLISSADRQALANDDYPTAPLEAKVPGFRQFRIIDEKGLSDHQNVQGQIHAHVHASEGTEWVVMRTDPLAIRGFWIPADGAFHEIILDRTEKWWKRHIIEREPANELPTGEPLVDLSKLPKVEGKLVTVTGEDATFLRRMAEARDLRDEAAEFYDSLVAQVKAGKFPIGAFECEDLRMYHSQRDGRKSTKVSEKDLAALIDPLRLQVELVAEAVKRRLCTEVAMREVLAEIADRVRVNPAAYVTQGAGYQEVKLYQLKAAAADF